MTAPWGSYFDSYMTLHMNPVQICSGRCWINSKSCTSGLSLLEKKHQGADGVWNLASFMCVSIYTSTLWWWMGPQVNESDILHLSIPLCHNESLCTDGNKMSSYQEMYHTEKLKVKYMILFRTEILLPGLGYSFHYFYLFFKKHGTKFVDRCTW